MKLKMLHESVSIGAIAIRPYALPTVDRSTGKKRVTDPEGNSKWYLKYSRQDSKNLAE